MASIARALAPRNEMPNECQWRGTAPKLPLSFHQTQLTSTPPSASLFSKRRRRLPLEHGRNVANGGETDCSLVQVLDRSIRVLQQLPHRLVCLEGPFSAPQSRSSGQLNASRLCRQFPTGSSQVEQASPFELYRLKAMSASPDSTTVSYVMPIPHSLSQSNSKQVPNRWPGNVRAEDVGLSTCQCTVAWCSKPPRGPSRQLLPGCRDHNPFTQAIAHSTARRFRQSARYGQPAWHVTKVQGQTESRPHFRLHLQRDIGCMSSVCSMPSLLPSSCRPRKVLSGGRRPRSLQASDLSTTVLALSKTWSSWYPEASWCPRISQNTTC